jgi:uncharacterized protein (UPF0216 family)
VERPRGVEVSRKTREAIMARYYRDINRLRYTQAAERPTLKELLARDPPIIELQDGSMHDVDRDQLERLSRIIPRYLWGLVRLPFTIQLTRYEDGTRVYAVSGDVWQKRAVELIVRGRMSPDGAERLEPEEFRQLLRVAGSMVFTSLNL